MRHAGLLAIVFAFSQAIQAQTYRFLVGTYTNTGKSQGIYAYEFNGRTHESKLLSVTSGVSNPSYLCITSDRKFVYSVNESEQGSAANAFSFQASTGTLSLLNRSLTNGKGPCFISSTKNHVFTANYGGGSLSVFGRNPDGSLSECRQKIQQSGSSIRSDRQAEPHVHQVLTNKYFVFANDLGTDRVLVFRYHPEATGDILTPWDTLNVRKGSGPRHLTFGKGGKRAYLVQELDGTVSVVSVSNGKLSLLQETSLLADTASKAWAADIHLSPDGKFLYATNRAPANNITCFRVDKEGRLEKAFVASTLGNGPRNFAITPDGSYLFVAHQFSDEIVVFGRNRKTGVLTDSNVRIPVGAPVCLVFY
jgi:6-phosphogluconolactonase